MKRPKKEEYAPFYEGYVQSAPKGNVATAHKKVFKDTFKSFASIKEEDGNYAYTEGKWTIKQLLQHLIDTERVFAFRAFVFMRGENASYPGFNQDDYVSNALVAHRTIADMLKEWKAVHQNTLFLLGQCTDEFSVRQGVASGRPISVRALFYIIPGHTNHHHTMLKKLYGAVVKE